MNNQTKTQKHVKGLAGRILTLKEYSKKINTEFLNSSTQSNEFRIDLADINTLVLRELSVLLFCKEYAEQRNGKLVLTNVSDTLNEYFELTRTEGCFTIRPASV